MHGRVDNTHADAFTHTVRLRDPEREVEVAVVALPSPTYVILDARARALGGNIEASALEGVRALAGVPMLAGLTRRVAAAAGGGEGAVLLVDAVVEAARLARQVAKLPDERARGAAGVGARRFWELDTTTWADLPDSCFTYSAEGRRRFDGRVIATPMTEDLYRPRPGQVGVFERRKVAVLERAGQRLALSHAMHDNVHGFEIRYEIDPTTGAIVAAWSETPRLPYMGICSEPQRKVHALVGQTVDADFRARLAALVGGSSGCAQLFDLTADVFKLLR